jgi:hypothetical protein
MQLLCTLRNHRRQRSRNLATKRTLFLTWALGPDLHRLDRTSFAWPRERLCRCHAVSSSFLPPQFNEVTPLTLTPGRFRLAFSPNLD